MGTMSTSGSVAMTSIMKSRAAPRGSGHALARGRPAPAQHDEHLADDGRDVRPVADADAHERAQVQQHVKEEMALLERVEVEQVLQYGQVSGARDGQELGEALHKPEEDGGCYSQMYTLPVSR